MLQDQPELLLQDLLYTDWLLNQNLHKLAVSTRTHTDWLFQPGWLLKMPTDQD